MKLAKFEIVFLIISLLAGFAAIGAPAERATARQHLSGEYPTPYPGPTIIVTNANDSGSGSLRQTIVDASNGDTITFASHLAGQTIRLQSTLTIDKNITIDASALSQKIILSGDSDNDGDGNVPILNILTNGNTTVINVEFTKGYTSSTAGGAITNSPGATATIKNSIFTENSGGAIGNAGTLTIENSIFSNNSSVLGGGALVHINGITKIYGSTFTGNSTQDHGGAIYNLQGVVEIYQSTISNNSANQGGAIVAGIIPYKNNTTTLISESVISNNQASLSGGGVEFVYGSGMTIDKTTISGNSAPAGGGVLNNSQMPLTITNSTISNNSATNPVYPGGIFELYSPLIIKTSTITGNSGSGIGSQGETIILNSTIAGNSGNGLEIFDFSLSLKNTIIANNTGVDCVNQSGTIYTNQNNLVETNSDCGTPLLNSDPMLEILGDNGGSTHTMSLLPGSPAINAGDDITCEATDQRGIDRPQGTHCDIGAFEFAPTFTDVSMNHWAWRYIESLYNAGITGGCGGGNYCPDNQVTRAQMAVFLLRGIHGSGYTPPAATGTVFNDVGAGDFAAAWIEQMVSEGITSGCGGGNYCPNGLVTRAQMAVFLLRAKYGSGYTPPAATETVFNDVPLGSFGAAWIEQLVSEGVTSGCGGGNYCPNAPVTRAQMAVFLVRTFNLP